MKTFIEAQNVTITVPFQWDGEPFVPDNGAITYDLRGQDGSLLLTGQAVAGISGTSINLVINAAQNQVTPGHAFEKRMLVIYATWNGDPWTHRINYRVCPWLNFTASADDVRAFVGVGRGELPDSDIDLVSAYFDCLGYIDDGNTAFEDALSSGGDFERQANRAIVAQAVILAMPSMQTRISQTENDGTISAQRFDIDFDDLEDRASDQLSRAINIITNRTIVPPPTVAVGYSPDPFRGRRRW